MWLSCPSPGCGCALRLNLISRVPDQFHVRGPSSSSLDSLRPHAPPRAISTVWADRVALVHLNSRRCALPSSPGLGPFVGVIRECAERPQLGWQPPHAAGHRPSTSSAIGWSGGGDRRPASTRALCARHGPGWAARAQAVGTAIRSALAASLTQQQAHTHRSLGRVIADHRCDVAFVVWRPHDTCPEWGPMPTCAKARVR